ncbi:tRNA glutamyl-Q(34) synthetase GluQRS [Basilea psittacipulmonis]|uniref:Glutamyl-Q tRNA(Asp) synthetase n=1 Tax=Basilea psittacipulmonis DSM 24701 TaxID=1072685 RepID=A0A077DCX8_9BURK|nr:tRNA glutamyl-Q(34) synthetase GluQRS [Basilea psittacipulmonis]AIL32026.1 hypothetical protein IX83_00620 [Basilea psittacipulmonis DSM 24701]
MLKPYIGRFAPSPSGPLHDGSLIAAMASYLDAKSHQGKWLLRIEDIDTPRVQAGADQFIMQQLQTLHMFWDGPVVWQSQRLSRYEEIFQQLHTKHLIYGCQCNRKTLTSVPKNKWGEYPYPNTCRALSLKNARAWRLIMPDQNIVFNDRYENRQEQNVAKEVGDIIIKRSDGLFSYQFVVVIDDIDQGITDIVRGRDLLSSTPRQILLAQQLNHPYPHTFHTPLRCDDQGHKLSKQNHAPALDLLNPIQTLNQAWTFLGFQPLYVTSIDDFWLQASYQWRQRFPHP